MKKTIPEYLQEICVLMATPEWCGERSPAEHTEADSQINEILQTIYTSFDDVDVMDLLEAMDAGPIQTIIGDRLELMAKSEYVAEIEAASIEIGANELQGMIDSGEVEPLSAEQVRKKLGHGTH